MTTLQQNLKAALDKAIFATGVTNSPAESITYRPKGASADDRAIQATVDRDDAELVAHAVARASRITVSNDATLGISSAEIDVGLDQILVVDRPGTAAQVRTIEKIASMNATRIVLELN